MVMRAGVALLNQIAASPGAVVGKGLIYPKADGNLYFKNAAGAERRVNANEVQDSGWIAPTLASPWTNYGAGWATAAYRKIDNVVYVRGLITGGTNSGVTPIWNFPAGYRPGSLTMHAIVVASSATTTEATGQGASAHSHTVTRGQVGSRCDVYGDGNVFISNVPGLTSSWVALNNIMFVAEA
jgi:hypothetical protein